ncbi:MAG: double zinc ribbon domain-containing protein [Spongiibacteraceae bacterium]|jgi:ComF family protein|nr:double zinc ribbon domain-containing protein [Spongiibacteraceae bacterium]
MVYKLPSWLDALSFAILPGECVLCRLPSGRRRDLCADCEYTLPWLGSCCAVCALPLATGGICGQCLRAPPPFATIRAAFCYDTPVDQLINRFKHRRQPACGRILGTLLADHLEETELPARPDALIPVPLHWRRHWRRGFNQAEILAWDLGQRLNLPVLGRALRRRRRTPAQQGLDARARRRNLRGAFQVRRPLDGLHLAVVDDVVTTAATSREVARTLLAAGAATVEIWCLARTP